MSSNSIYGKLDRVRKPRVHIKYDVYIGDATEKKELPFVVGVLGDFSGNPTAPLKEMSKRNFVEINRDNFNDIMAKMTPGANFRVENTLKGDGTEFAVALKFSSIDDFEPTKVARQVEPLRKLLETREKLRDMMTRADRYEDLEKLMEEVLKNTDEITKVSTALTNDKPASPEDKGGNA
jgi:type VI secretion system protein ImpB